MRLFQKFAEFFNLRARHLPLDASHIERGRFGEDLAAHYCKKQLGYKLLLRNWRCRGGEIDLICRDGKVLVFIEVRLRQAGALIAGVDSIDKKKKAILNKACCNFLSQTPAPVLHFRFDIIDVALNEEGVGKVRHFANVPLFSKHYTAKSYSK